MYKKLTTVLLLASMAAVAACSNASNDPKNSGTATNTPATGDPAAAADPFGKYKDPVKISIAYSVDPAFKSTKGETLEKNAWKTAIKNDLNIEFDIAWQVSKENFDQKMNLSIASNDLPDVMVVSQVQLNQMVKAGAIEDLTEVYNNYASPAVKKIIDSTKGLAKEQVTFDGKMMAIPNVSAEDFNMLWIRQDWLDKLGLKPPKTVEELQNVAKAFVEQDPDGNKQADTIGIAAGTALYNDFTGGPGSMDLTPIFAAYDSYPGVWVEGADGKPAYGSNTTETKNALAKLREMYAAGLIDKEIGIRKAAEETVISGKAGMFFEGFYGGYWPLPSAWQNDPKANWQAYALPLDAEGKYNVKVANPSSGFLVVRKGYENPEAPIKLNNLYLRDEAIHGNDFMMVRNFFAPLDEIGFEYKALQEVLAGTKKPEDFGDMPEYKLLKNSVATIKNSKLEPYDKMDIQYWNQSDKDFMRAFSIMVGAKNHYDPAINKMTSVSYARTKTVEKKWTNLRKLESETFLKIIMGSAPLESFDKYVEDWSKQGGSDILLEIEETVKK
ncbi:extracellular solute-binding protein [Paenibacillus herberti]|uniref:Sugar ABC transporter substrate-binding protein n=1 Tax=Paenibacillus herberti TaxID=1619309 RepID=A0A229NTY5_9BACL|nr:extracellular solute-binding protein [Paenibacillus herberti]OXM13328.1 sugar ABC transporter substrate-binding protein [Paenibacillus herberti]